MATNNLDIFFNFDSCRSELRSKTNRSGGGEGRKLNCDRHIESRWPNCDQLRVNEIQY